MYEYGVIARVIQWRAFNRINPAPADMLPRILLPAVLFLCAHDSLHLIRLQETPVATRERQVIGNIRRSIDAMEELFNALLDISQLDAGVVQSHITTIPLAAVFDPPENGIQVVEMLPNEFKVDIPAPLVTGTHPRGVTERGL